MIYPISNLEEMNRLAAGLAASLRLGDVVALDGPLGAGKTHFAKSLVAHLGYDGDVTSPTFPLLHEYLGGRCPIYHLDFYRLASLDEAQDAGLEEYLPGDGVALVEWASKFPEILPATLRKVTIRITGETQREVEIENPRH